MTAKTRKDGGVSRREILLLGATAAAAGIPLAQAAPATNYGAPVVELQVPAGILSLEQKAAMHKGMTDVILKALHMPLDQNTRLFSTIIETPEGGFGVNGQVFAPRK